ncbi:MAG: hypothetical protein AABX51_06780 [Nanoarchaeota archaeon]
MGFSRDAILKELFKRKKLILILAPISVLFFLKPVVVVLFIFILIGSVSTIYKSRLNIGLDLELQSFFTIAAGAIYGPNAGVAVGFFSVIIGHALNLMFFSNPILSIIYAASFAFLGMLSAQLPANALVIVAAVYIIANDIIFIFLGSMMGANPGRLIFSAVVHPVFVFVLLSRLLIPFVKVMGG